MHLAQRPVLRQVAAAAQPGSGSGVSVVRPERLVPRSTRACARYPTIENLFNETVRPGGRVSRAAARGPARRDGPASEGTDGCLGLPLSWSGGKDSCAALLRTHASFDVVAMVTMFDEPVERSCSHGLRPEVLSAQAERLRLRQVIGRRTWPTYDIAFAAALRALKDDDVTHVIFGDILFEEQPPLG